MDEKEIRKLAREVIGRNERETKLANSVIGHLPSPDARVHFEVTTASGEAAALAGYVEAAQIRLTELAAKLPGLRREHFRAPACPDGSCYCSGEPCGCGADAHNARVDELIALAEGKPC